MIITPTIRPHVVYNTALYNYLHTKNQLGAQQILLTDTKCQQPFFTSAKLCSKRI